MPTSQWVLFALSVAIAAFLSAYELYTLDDTCFVEAEGYDPDQLRSTSTLGDDGAAEAHDAEQVASSLLKGALVWSMLVEVASALLLSAMYGAPVRVTTIHKLQDDASRQIFRKRVERCHCRCFCDRCEACIVESLAPASLMLGLIATGIASSYMSTYEVCDGQGGAQLKEYFFYSGLTFTVWGGIFLALLHVKQCGLCGSDFGLFVVKFTLPQGSYISLLRGLQAVVWLYHFGLAAGWTILLGVLVIIGGAIEILGNLYQVGGDEGLVPSFSA